MKHVYFVGIGGIGMSALASLMLKSGYEVMGSDLSSSDLTLTLEQDGASISYTQEAANIDSAIEGGLDLLVYSEAILPDHPERARAKGLAIEELSYAAALAEFTKDYELILISGTHGKTTVTAMVAKILIDAGFDPTVVLGSKMKELDNRNFRLGKSKYCVVEGCEYKRSFLNFRPQQLLITNIDVDHLDYYKNKEDYESAFRELIAKMPDDGSLIYNSDDVALKKILEKFPRGHFCYNRQDFEEVFGQADSNADSLLKLSVPGLHNRYNAMLALTLALQLGIDRQLALNSLADFSGTWRRLEKVGEYQGVKIYDDYAHHPTEIKASLQALRELYPTERICCVFQPHQFNRTYNFLDDFAVAFNDADAVVIPNIYQVRDKKEDVQHVSPELLVQKIKEHHADVHFGGGLDETEACLKAKIADFDVLVLMGAGDVTKLRVKFVG